MKAKLKWDAHHQRDDRLRASSTLRGWGFTVLTFPMHRSGRKLTLLEINFKLTLFTVFIDVFDKDLIS